jgi:hypothetical protein
VLIDDGTGDAGGPGDVLDRRAFVAAGQEQLLGEVEQLLLPRRPGHPAPPGAQGVDRDGWLVRFRGGLHNGSLEPVTYSS